MGAPVTPKLIDGMVSLMRKQAAWRSDLGLTIEPEPTAHTEYTLRHIFGWTERTSKTCGSASLDDQVDPEVFAPAKPINRQEYMVE
jgi:hypothetical protein